MAAIEPYKGVYAKMEFPDYVYREYPKMLKTKDGREIVVKNHAEELRAVDEIVHVKDFEKVESEKAKLEGELAALKAEIAAIKAGAAPADASPVVEGHVEGEHTIAVDANFKRK